MEYAIKLLNARKNVHGDINISSKATLRNTYCFIGHWEDNRDDELPHTFEECMRMIFHKLSRVMCGDHLHKDHYDDIGGYAKLIQEQFYDFEVTSNRTYRPGMAMDAQHEYLKNLRLAWKKSKPYLDMPKFLEDQLPLLTLHIAALPTAIKQQTTTHLGDIIRIAWECSEGCEKWN